jgi:hypothetical protein
MGIQEMKKVLIIKAVEGEEPRALQVMKSIWKKFDALQFSPEEFNFICPLKNEIDRLEGE